MNKVTVCLTVEQMDIVIDAMLDYMDKTDKASRIFYRDGKTWRATREFYGKVQTVYHELVNAPEEDV